MISQDELDKLKSLVDSGRLDVAKQYLHRYESLNRNDKNIAFLLGQLYNRLDNFAEAERYYRKTLRLDAGFILAYVMLEQLLRIQHRYQECESILNRVKILRPDMSGVVDTSLSMISLGRGKYRAGFKGYENRFSYKHMGDAYATPLFPRWDGKASLQGKSVLMRFEQGLGDTLQFCRYAKNLKLLGAARVDVLCKRCLHRLVKTVDGVDSVADSQLQLSVYDFEVMMMSMPFLLKTSKISDISGKPYFSVSQQDSKVWSDKLNRTNKLKVGLVWSGELKKSLDWDSQRMNRHRSIPLELLRPILDLDCDFYSLQLGDEQRSQLNGFYSASLITDLMGEVSDFYDTACLADNMDVIVSVDSAPVHALGGLGKPVLMFSRLDSDWRWLDNRPKTPWYDSVEIFGQSRFLDWSDPIHKVCSKLAGLLKRDI